MTDRGGRLLAVTGGHRVDLDAFAAMADGVCAQLGWTWEHAVQPEAQRWLRPEHAGRWDAVLLHDLPGLRLARGTTPVAHGPDADDAAAVLQLLDVGQGVVATHHALAGWPLWDGWAEVLGGRFLYAPGTLRDYEVPASGYRMDHYRVDVVDADHPVCAGVDPFEVDDELYLCPVFEHEVHALLATRADTAPATMIDTFVEVRDGRQVPAAAQPGSKLLAWTTTPGASRVVYVLPGHTASTMAAVPYRRLLANALAWVATSTVSRSPRAGA